MASKVSKSTIALTEKTMLGDLCHVVIDELKAAPDVWQKLSEEKQREAIERMRKRLTKTIRDAVKFFSSDGSMGIDVDVDAFNGKDGGMKIVLRASRGFEQAQQIVDICGHPALLVVTSAEQHLGGDTPKPEPNQRALNLAEAAKNVENATAVGDALKKAAATHMQGKAPPADAVASNATARVKKAKPKIQGRGPK
jgi:hypothetical protein